MEKSFLVGVGLGACIGGTVGYFYFTESGQRRRNDVARVLDRLVMELNEVRALWLQLQELGDQYRRAREGFHAGDASRLDFRTGGVA